MGYHSPFARSSVQLLTEKQESDSIFPIQLHFIAVNILFYHKYHLSYYHKSGMTRYYIQRISA